MNMNGLDKNQKYDISYSFDAHNFHFLMKNDAFIFSMRKFLIAPKTDFLGIILKKSKFFTVTMPTARYT